MKILIDTLGADKGVKEIVEASILALDKTAYEPILVGPEEEIRSYLRETDLSRLTIVDAKDQIFNEDKPTHAIRRKKESSMVKALKLLKEGQAEGMISPGSTGALLAGATLIVGRIDNVERAAITLIIPGLKSNTIMLDVGANMDISPDLGLKFAKMAKSYAKVVFDHDNPRIGLLNIGLEEGKGNDFSIKTYELLKESDLNFVGNIEPYDLMTTDADIILTDGFAGNIALKTAEGVGKNLLKLFKKAIMSNYKTKLGGLLLKNSLKKTLDNLDLDSTGAAPLLGSKKPVFKAHGSTSKEQFSAGIIQLVKFIETGVIEDIEKDMKEEGESNDRRQNNING